MLAEILTNHDLGEIAALVAVILAVVAAWNGWPERDGAATLGWLAVAALSFWALAL